jgi:GT2 family glycosyltransferase
MQKSVAIILINWNSFTLTHACIASIEQTAETNYDIVVVDNASEDGSVNQLKELHPNIILLQSAENRGFTGGNNLGLQWAMDHGYTYSFLLNNDTIVAENFLSPLIHFLDENPEAGAVQSKIYFLHNKHLIWNAGGKYHPWFCTFTTIGYHTIDQGQYDLPKKIDWITGCAFFVRNAILKQTGLFAENLFMYYEDADLSCRILNKGYFLQYLPASTIYHMAGMASKKTEKTNTGYLHPRVHYFNARNRIWMIKKYSNWYAMPSVLLYHFVYYVMVMVYFIVRRRFTKLRFTFNGISDGLQGSFKNYLP